MTTIEVLKAARERISDPNRWTQGTYSRHSDGSPAWNSGRLAGVCWCASGAVQCCLDLGATRFATDCAFDDLCRTLGGGCAVRYNDTHTHAEVLALFDRTIARLEAKR